MSQRNRLEAGILLNVRNVVKDLYGDEKLFRQLADESRVWKRSSATVTRPRLGSAMPPIKTIIKTLGHMVQWSQNPEKLADRLMSTLSDESSTGLEEFLQKNERWKHSDFFEFGGASGDEVWMPGTKLALTGAQVSSLIKWACVVGVIPTPLEPIAKNKKGFLNMEEDVIVSIDARLTLTINKNIDGRHNFLIEDVRDYDIRTTLTEDQVNALNVFYFMWPRRAMDDGWVWHARGMTEAVTYEDGQKLEIKHARLDELREYAVMPVVARAEGVWNHIPGTYDYLMTYNKNVFDELKNTTFNVLYVGLSDHVLA